MIDARLAAIEAKLDTLAPLLGGRMRGEPAAAAVEALERSEGVPLPEEHRAFLLRVGDGAPGLLPLARWADALVDGAPLRTPCPLDPRKGFQDYIDAGDDEPARGTVALTPGDPHTLLVVSGERRGQILSFDINDYWSEVVEHARGEPAGFLEWYEAWLDCSHQRRLALLADGLLGTEDELIAALGPSVADPRRRTKAAVELGQRTGASPPALAALDAACEDPSPRVRLQAVLALHRQGSPSLLARLTAASADASPKVRREVVHLVHWLPPEPRADLLHRMVADDDDRTVFRTVAALLDPKPALDELAGLVALPSVRRVADARGLVLHALGDSGDLRWLPELLGWLEHEHEGTRVIAVIALGKLGSSIACGPLRALLARETDAYAKRAIERVLEGLRCSVLAP